MAAAGKHYGDVSEEASDRGKAAYQAFLSGGGAGFKALLGSGRSEAGQYARLQVYGFYWAASKSNPASAWFYHFGKDKQAVHRQSSAEKQRRAVNYAGFLLGRCRAFTSRKEPSS